mmetsp:Transcript_7846/g.8585  ORF Transcript_7846/g.8585 Transcript_7846/m.8585 type:complete len:144 (+) Transcript_7846:229-660(+)|eukprot:CAMPEP_0173154836 /NCGR_PEP_ID=MMETSP1105-20130129/13726_1 /TAXON_ID=2985 /ORGANISM="Ochromonas sp., Strain BG-1" /LENGTH=143 /DNA_ID=CAMNT_0014071105 /DNA_START=159 /DNA_END=590 /DNA_ORIENTATION=-
MKRSYRCADLVELERESIKIQKICDYMDDLNFIQKTSIIAVEEELIDLDDITTEGGDDLLNNYGDTSSEDLSIDLENDAELGGGKSFGPRRFLRCNRRRSSSERTASSDDSFSSFDDIRKILSDCSEKKREQFSSDHSSVLNY